MLGISILAILVTIFSLKSINILLNTAIFSPLLPPYKFSYEEIERSFVLMIEELEISFLQSKRITKII